MSFSASVPARGSAAWHCVYPAAVIRMAETKREVARGAVLRRKLALAILAASQADAAAMSLRPDAECPAWSAAHERACEAAWALCVLASPI